MKRWKDAITRNQDIIISLGLLSVLLAVIGFMYFKSADII